MKRFLTSSVTGALLGTLLLGTMPAYADTETHTSDDGLWKYDDYNGVVSVSLLDKTVTEAKVPAQIDGITITAVEVDCFKDCENLKSVVLPDTIEQIKDYAFYTCPNLETVNIPESVKKIGFMAFYGCSSLQEMHIPAATEEIDYFAFEGCSSLDAIDVADANRNYKDEDGILFDYEGKTLILYPSSKTDTAYTVPAGCNRIEDYAFIGNTYLQSVNIDNITELGEEVFYYCTALEEISVPDTITELKGSMFGLCQSLRSVRLPANLTSIGNSCFYGCVSLQEIDIPESVTSIGDYAFFNCGSLDSIRVTKNVTNIGNYAMGFYYSDGEEPSILPGFEVDADKDTLAFSYCAVNNIKCTGGVTQEIVFIYIVLGIIALVIIATIILIIVQKKIQKRYELR